MKHPALMAMAMMAAPAFAVDHTGCERTGLLYAHYADTNQPAKLAGLFTDNAVWQTTTGRSVGRAGIEQQLASATGSELVMRHVVTNHLIFEDENGALSGRSYFTLYVSAPDATDLATQPVMQGTYEDTYVLDGGRCLFSSRRSTATFRRPPPDEDG